MGLNWLEARDLQAQTPWLYNTVLQWCNVEAEGEEFGYKYEETKAKQKKKSGDFANASLRRRPPPAPV